MTVQRTPEVIAELDRRHCIHPYVEFDRLPVEDNLVVASGSGARLVDVFGNEYIDAVGGVWCTQIGLGRDEMADAVRRAP